MQSAHSVGRGSWEPLWAVGGACPVSGVSVRRPSWHAICEGTGGDRQQGGVGGGDGHLIYMVCLNSCLLTTAITRIDEDIITLIKS